MNGRVVVGGLVGLAALAGAAMYYLQVYHFYDRVTLPAENVVVARAQGGAVVLGAQGIEAIDAGSSPIRFRACFTLPPGTTLPEDAIPYPEAEPLTAPGWFSCFDAAAIGAALERGEARAVLGQAGIHPQVDRVIALLPDGRGFVWHQLHSED